jgi:hypothetical protein
LTVQAIALWLMTPSEKVLLKTKHSEKYGLEINQPLKAWQKKNESKQGAIRRLLKEELGGSIPNKLLHFHFSEQVREEPFVVGSKTAIRTHYFCKMSIQPFTGDLQIIFVGREDWLRLRTIIDPDKNPEKDIILYDFDYEMLSEILGIQTVITQW